MTIVTNEPAVKNREIQRDARAWAEFSGLKYTEALRLMQHPLTQGILGERVSARQVIRVLTEHPLLSDTVEDTDERYFVLLEHGLFDELERPLEYGEPEHYLEVVLCVEFLRMFDLTHESDFVNSSRELKHTAETFFREHLGDHSYISNGKLIWAAVVLGLELAPGSDFDWRSVYVKLPLWQPEYVDKMLGRVSGVVGGHQRRPAGMTHLLRALEEYRDTGAQPERWDPAVASAERAPHTSRFHEWLVEQYDHGGDRPEMGTRAILAHDYDAGVRDSDHEVALDGDHLVQILERRWAAESFIEQARLARDEWKQLEARQH